MWDNRDVEGWEPNFIVIGAPKSGTTSIYHYLKQHPEVFLPEKKELHFFSHPEIQKNTNGPGDKYVAKDVCSNWDQYRENYKKAQNHQTRGDISPSYVIYPIVADRIKSSLGQIKIIVMLRDPVEKAFSQYSHLRGTNRETLSFENALKAEEVRKAEGWGDFWWYVHSTLVADSVKYYQDTFGHENVLVLSSENLRHHGDATMKKVCLFLGILSEFKFDINREFNPSGLPRSKVVANLIKPTVLTSLMRKILPQKVGSKIRRAIMNLNRGEKPKMSSTEREYLEKVFAKERVKLQALLTENAMDSHDQAMS